MIRRLLTATALVAGLALPAQAEDPAPEPAPAGTDDEAAALRTAFAAYLTQMPFDMGLLRIEPDPAGQRLTIDPVPVLRDFVKGEAEAAPLSVLVSRRTDGDWNVFTRDPIDLRFETRIETETDETTATFAYDRAERHAGETNYPLGKMMRLAFDRCRKLDRTGLPADRWPRDLDAGVRDLLGG